MMWDRRHLCRLGARLAPTVLVLVSGCSAYAPKLALDQNGLANPDTLAPSSINLFNAHFESLYARSIEAKPGAPVAAGPRPPADEVRDFTLKGAHLAYQFCSSFFKRAGTEQQYLMFSRDVIGVVGALATGVLGATRSSPAAAAAIGLGSAAGLSGISIYSRNFLFSEDNVEAVRELTLRAMSAQADAALRRAADNHDYRLLDSVQDIMDIQAVCEVQKIVSLVRQSINQSQPIASNSPSGHISTGVPEQQAVSPTTLSLKVVGVGVSTEDSAILLQNYLRSVRSLQREQRRLRIEDAARSLGFGNVEADSFVLDTREETRPKQDAVARRLGLSQATGG